MTALLHLAPTSRVMYSSDASRIPELFYLGAREGRRVVQHVLEATVADGDLTWAEAEVVAQHILAGNAHRLYRV
ncbi:MAG TPA: amidohydrolase [Candidatus Xenobia bacterium]